MVGQQSSLATRPAKVLKALKLLDYEDVRCPSDQNRGNQVAQLLFDASVSITGDLGLYEFEFTHSLYGVAVILVDMPEETVDRCLARIQLWWKLLEQLEADMRSSPRLKTMWDHFWWPGMQWCREVLIDLHQVGFSHVPDYTKRKVRIFQQAIRTSLMSELGGNKLRSRETAHVSKKLVDLSRWHALLTSSVLPDQERPHVKITPATTAAKPDTLPRDLCKLGDWQVSIGAEFDRLRNEADWLSTTHLERMKCFLSWASFVKLGGNWEDHQNSWQSLLAIKGHLLFKDASSPCGIVCCTTQYGVIVKKVTKMKSGSTPSHVRSMNWKCDLRLGAGPF